MKKVRKLLILPLLACLLFLFGCGYDLVREKGEYNGAITSLSVPVFKNLSFEPQVPGFFTEAFSQELAASGLFDINRAGSDSVLQGTITNVTAQPTSLGTTGQAVAVMDVRITSA